MVELRGILRQLRWLRATTHFLLPYWQKACRAQRGCRSLPGKMLVVEHRRISRDPRRNHAKSHPGWDGFLHGGAEGNRTPVRKQLDRTFFGRSLLFTFPYRGVNKHTQRFGRVMMHGRGNSYPPHVRHSDHTQARFVALPGRMGA